MEAQRFPADYDGIVAGASANPRTALNAVQLSLSQTLLENESSFIPPAKYQVIHQAVVETCDIRGTSIAFHPGGPMPKGRRWSDRLFDDPPRSPSRDRDRDRRFARADAAVPPRASINYYTRAVNASGGPAAAGSWVRLFMVPGMHHCSGGEGPDTFHMVGALEQWVEHGTAPDRILASHISDGRADRTRPLCPYPQVAV
jgi:hypothetical protein